MVLRLLMLIHGKYNKELQIGTAAPTKAQLERVKHHLLRVKTLTIITLQVFTSKMY